MAYRIGDSTTNLISPLMSYFALIVTFASKYDKKSGIGTLISTMVLNRKWICGFNDS